MQVRDIVVKAKELETAYINTAIDSDEGDEGKLWKEYQDFLNQDVCFVK